MNTDTNSQQIADLFEALKASVDQLFCSDQLSEEDKLNVIHEAHRILKDWSGDSEA